MSVTDWAPVVTAAAPIFLGVARAYFQNRTILEEQRWARLRHYRLEWMMGELSKKTAPGLLDKVPDNLKTGIHKVPLLDVFAQYDAESEPVTPVFGPPPDWVPPKGKP